MTGPPSRAASAAPPPRICIPARGGCTGATVLDKAGSARHRRFQRHGVSRDRVREVRAGGRGRRELEALLESLDSSRELDPRRAYATRCRRPAPSMAPSHRGAKPSGEQSSRGGASLIANGMHCKAWRGPAFYTGGVPALARHQRLARRARLAGPSRDEKPAGGQQAISVTRYRRRIASCPPNAPLVEQTSLDPLRFVGLISHGLPSGSDPDLFSRNTTSVCTYNWTY